METVRFAAIATWVQFWLAAGTAPGQQLPERDWELGCDRSAISWFVPGQFNEARKRAKEEKRLLIIKGISFGVDEAGAKCATKGKW